MLRNSPIALEVRAVLAEHRVWIHGKSIRLYRKGHLYNAHVRAGDVTPDLAPVEPPEESWTMMEVDDGDHDEQDEADQPEELKRVLAARQPTEVERQEYFSDESCCLRTLCEVCVKAKGTGAQHRRQTIKELAKQEQDGPRIYSDFFYCRRQESLLR